MSDESRIFILGAGVTGLSAGLATGLEILDSGSVPGGVRTSYYAEAGSRERRFAPPESGEAYRFEIGGGHWILESDRHIAQFIQRLTPCHTYRARSAVYFQHRELFAPYPVVREEDERSILARVLIPSAKNTEMKEWLTQEYGDALCDVFFFPFHNLMSAGLYDSLAARSNPGAEVSVPMVLSALHGTTPRISGDSTFLYPVHGLDALMRTMAERCTILGEKHAQAIDIEKREITFADGTSRYFDKIISTLPLHRMIEMTGIDIGIDPDPYTSLMVLNIGALRGESCPDEHLIYCSDSKAGFHRIGFYSNVDPSFLPRSHRESQSHVSLYVEKSFPAATTLSTQEVDAFTALVLQELKDWEFITRAEVVDTTWIEVAQTWTVPNSPWRECALHALESHGIHQIGRKACWNSQGIADSIRDGLLCAPLVQLWRAGRAHATGIA